MSRFVAIAWDDRDLHGQQEAAAIRRSLSDAHTWTTLTDSAGLAVYIPGGRDHVPAAIPLPHEAGVILGTIFKRSSSADLAGRRETQIGEHQSREILQTQGRSLIESHWGSYILFLRCEERVISVFRGPAGMLSCYYLTHQGLTICVTHASDLRRLCPGVLSINWDSIRAQAAAGDYLTRETGLTGVAALLSGECINIHQGRVSHRAYWNPARLPIEAISNLSDAAMVLHQETHRCVGAWASQHKTLLLLLSGGLDSSIVLSCVRQRAPDAQVIAVNFYSAGAGDERRFARSMAARTQTRLEEVPSNINIDLRDFLRCALTPSPVLDFTAFDVEPVMDDMAQRWNATALFTGETGDDVLGHAPMPEALSEILQRPDQLHRFLSASLDYAELTRISVWRAMRLAFRNLRWLQRIRVWSLYRHRQLAGHTRAGSLISDAAADQYEAMIARFLHPWFQDAQELPLGKVMLLHSLIQATSSVSHSPFNRSDALPSITPLMSQPLIEAVLRIPSHLHFLRAENGAVARTAFRDALSPEVLERGTAKGSPTGWARTLIDKNATFLGSLLREGILVEKGILDRAKIDTLLSNDVSRSRIGVAELIRQVYIEVWLRRWVEEGARL